MQKNLLFTYIYSINWINVFGDLNKFNAGESIRIKSINEFAKTAIFF